MNVLQAAEQVLTEAEEPLHYREITRRMLQRQLWTPQGKTPDRSVSSSITTHIGKYGSSSRFQRTAEGVYALRRWGLPEYPSTRPPSDRTATSIALSPGSNGNLSQPMPARQTLSFTDAAEYVLEHFGNRMPMHYRDITEKALELGLLRTSGQTPKATLSSQIGTEIARQEQRGEVPRFVRHGKGKVSLSRWHKQAQPRELAKLIKQHNDEVALEPWIHSLLELMKHAEEHLQANGEFDRRIALIGYDNAIEVSISTYLQLHPTQRGGASYPNEQVNKWLANYHSLLDFFFDGFMKTLGQIPPVAKQNVIHYHTLRNDLYHKGKSLVPTERDIKDARKAALYIFSTLFKVKGEELIQTLPPLHMWTTRKFNFQGNGSDICKVPLKVGPAIFRFKYEGRGYLTADLNDEDDKHIARVVKPLGTFEENGTTHIYKISGPANIKKDGEYLLSIHALGAWQVEVEQ